MKKKICIITTVSATIKAFLIDTIEYLQENGYGITVICNEDENLIKELPVDVNYIPLKMNRGIKIRELIPNIYTFIKVFKTENFDLVQYSTPNASLYASIAAYICGVPIRLYCQWGIIYVGFSGIKRFIFKLIEKTVCYLSTDVQPDSFGNLKFSHSEKLYKAEKSKVIWNGSASGVNFDKFNISNKNIWKKEIRKKHDMSEDAFVFGFVGRLNKDKGINELLSAFKEISYSYKECKLLIVGDKEKIQEIDANLYEWSLNSNSVIYVGKTSEVEKYYSMMDVFILPSYREGFGSVVIEAEAMGVPVIVSDIPGPTDAMIVNQTGLIVKKGDSISLRKAMIKLYEDEKLLNDMSNNAYLFVKKNFDNKKLKKYILEDRNNLINRKNK